jgi:hypothetical protein
VEDVDVDGNKVLEWILRQKGGNECIWFGIGTSGELL